MPAAPASEPDFTVTVDGRRWPVRLHRLRPSSLGRARDAVVSAMVSPLAGTLTRVEVVTGQRVEEGALLAVVEAMKMETPVLAPFAGTIMEVRSLTGGSVTAGETIVVIDPGGSG